MEKENLIQDTEYDQINQLYDECLEYLNKYNDSYDEAKTDNDLNSNNDIHNNDVEPTIDHTVINNDTRNNNDEQPIDYTVINNDVESRIGYKVINELKSNESLNSLPGETKPERLRRLSKQLPKIIITQSNTSLEKRNDENHFVPIKREEKKPKDDHRTQPLRKRHCNYPKRLVSKAGVENVALISNVPFEKIRLLNDTFHTLINLRWRWIVIGTVVLHFAIWLVFAVFWYITALAHYDFEPEPPQRLCVTGGKDFVTIFLASVEAQTTIGFGDRAIDEECPESIFLFVMQLILGTGLSGVLTCVVYAKLTRPEKLSRDGVGFSKKAVISMRDGRLCLMFRAWDLNYDHIICSEFTAHYIHIRKTKEGEVIRYYAYSLRLQQRQFLLWPVTLLHVIDSASPLYHLTPQQLVDNSYEITISLKGASASMGTFTQSQSSYLPREVVWGHRFPSVVRYDTNKQKYVIDHHKLDCTESVDTPYCSAYELDNGSKCSEKSDRPGTPGSFSEKVSTFHLQRTSSFKKKLSKML